MPPKTEVTGNNNKKGKISIAFVACRDVMPDPGFYADCLTTAFDELHAATEPKPARTKAKAKAKNKARRQTASKSVA